MCYKSISPIRLFNTMALNPIKSQQYLSVKGDFHCDIYYWIMKNGIDSLRSPQAMAWTMSSTLLITGPPYFLAMVQISKGASWGSLLEAVRVLYKFSSYGFHPTLGKGSWLVKCVEFPSSPNWRMRWLFLTDLTNCSMRFLIVGLGWPSSDPLQGTTSWGGRT